MKKKVMALVLTGIMLMPTLAYAKGEKETLKGKPEVQKQFERNTVKMENKAIDKEAKAKLQENNTKVQENKAAIEEFKTQIKEKHEIMKANTKKSIELKKQINSKKQELSSILKEIKAGTKTLSPEQLELLTAKADTVKETADAVKALPAISSDTDTTQENIKGKKFEAALASLDKVIAKQEARYAKLVELNDKMDALLAIAKQAQTVTTSDSPSTDIPASPTNTTDATTITQ